MLNYAQNRNNLHLVEQVSSIVLCKIYIILLFPQTGRFLSKFYFIVFCFIYLFFLIN